MTGYYMGSNKVQSLEDLQKELGYKFTNSGVLRDALTHTSVEGYAPDVMGYERLEFLGDRILGLVVAETLLKQFPKESEGSIAKRHTAVVQRKALVAVAIKINLGRYLHLSEGELKTGGREKQAILSDATEALIAAIYIDGGFDMAQKFVQDYWQDLIDTSNTPPEDPKTQLQEWVQARQLPLPVYNLISEVGTSHEPVFEMEVVIEGFSNVMATASSKKNAEKKAAEILMKIIKEKGNNS